ncbi:hypothetical protein V8F06_014551 [Rhypophila decipiens]
MVLHGDELGPKHGSERHGKRYDNYYYNTYQFPRQRMLMPTSSAKSLDRVNLIGMVTSRQDVLNLQNLEYQNTLQPKDQKTGSRLQRRFQRLASCMSTCKGLLGILGWNTWPSGIWTVCQAEAAKDFGIAMAFDASKPGLISWLTTPSKHTYSKCWVFGVSHSYKNWVSVGAVPDAEAALKGMGLPPQRDSPQTDPSSIFCLNFGPVILIFSQEPRGLSLPQNFSIRHYFNLFLGTTQSQHLTSYNSVLARANSLLKTSTLPSSPFLTEHHKKIHKVAD